MDFPVSCRLLIIMMAMIFMIMLPNSDCAQSDPGIPLSVPLFAGNAYSTWTSPSGDFAFGFRQVSPSGGYLLAIMFDKMPETEKTIVWSANRDHPVEQGSRVQLYANGRYELRDTRDNTIWSANVIGSGGVDCGAMLDNGNFVLKRNNSVVWQSFDEPTDTLLPEQELNQNGSLFAGVSETNFSTGRFKFILQTDGNLVLYTLQYPTTDYVVAYWYTQTINTGYQVIFNQSGNIYLAARNGTTLNRISSSGVPASKFYQRLTLDCDGVLRQYVFPKSNKSTRGRPMRWSVGVYTPRDTCLRVGGTRGRGVCGLNGLCTLGNNRTPNCSCPDGYSLRDRNKEMSGCKPDHVRQSFGGKSNSGESDGFNDVASTDWPYLGYGYGKSVSGDWCGHPCLVECFVSTFLSC